MPLKRHNCILIVLLVLCSISTPIYPQRPKVGIVLSGGGASGLAHIGFLRSLEENNIPIDYIAGTSMGAFVGALYASGFTPDQMEEIFKSKEFEIWSSGKIDDKYNHYFKKNIDDASWVRLKLTLDSILETNLPTNLINSTSLDFGLSKLFSDASAVSKNNFNDLMIPFRCVASDIISRKSYEFKSGDLAMAVRSSISYPFFLNPVSKDGMLLYDGGLYNNFPVSTLCNSFEPDYIIGCNVSGNFTKPDEDHILSQIRSMMSIDTEYKINCEKGFIIEPPVSEIGLLDFNHVSEVVAEGYQATQMKIDSIKAYFPYKTSTEEINKKRTDFLSKKPTDAIIDIQISGLGKSQKNFISRSIKFKPEDSLNYEELQFKILKLASDERIKYIQPELVYDWDKNGYVLKLFIKRDKKLFVSFGGNISTSAVNEGFVALQYNHFNLTPITLYGNTYFGKFYSSGTGLVKVDIPSYFPFQLGASYTLNKLDYFQNSNILIDQSSPSYLISRDNYGQLSMAFPISYKGKLNMGANFGEVKYEYYQENEFTRFDTADITEFTNANYFLKFDHYSLNKKQYPTKGSNISFKATYYNGHETTNPGSASPNDSIFVKDHSWFTLKGKIDTYFNSNHKVKFGFLLEGVYSDQPFFSNYASTILSAPSFEPTPESKTVFRSRYRAHRYGAMGIKTIYSPLKNFDVRLEGYVFRPFNQINSDAQFHAFYDTPGTNRYFIGSFTLMYDLTFTQIAVNVNYYDNFNEEFPSNKNENYTVMLHLGFILFNQKMLD